MGNYTFTSGHSSLVIDDKDYNVLKKKSKDYYSLLLCKKTKFPNRSLTLKLEFDLTGDQLQKVYILSHTVLFTRLDLPQTATAPFVSLILKPLATSFSTVYTRSLFGKSLNFIFILFQKNLSLYVIISIMDSKRPC